jgi:hypothetical protein
VRRTYVVGKCKQGPSSPFGRKLVESKRPDKIYLGIDLDLSRVDGKTSSTLLSCMVVGTLGGATIIEEETSSESVRVSPSMSI